MVRCVNRHTGRSLFNQQILHFYFLSLERSIAFPRSAVGFLFKSPLHTVCSREFCRLLGYEPRVILQRGTQVRSPHNLSGVVDFSGMSILTCTSAGVAEHQTYEPERGGFVERLLKLEKPSFMIIRGFYPYNRPDWGYKTSSGSFYGTPQGCGGYS